MIFSAVSALILAAASVSAINTNPKVSAPFNMTYQAGNVVEIQWESADTGYLNIDLVDLDANILQFPVNIANGVPAGAGKYSWTVPQSLKSATGYQIRVWGSNQPNPGSNGEGISQMFTVLNTIPLAVNKFTVLTPNKEQPCLAGTDCKITWDFPADANLYPAMVDIALFRVGQLEPIAMIATVASSDKSFTWHVPADYAGSPDVYMSVSGQGSPLAGPAQGNDMGANSQAFSITNPPPAPQPENKDDKKDDKKKTEAQNKKDDKPKDDSKIKKESKNSGAVLKASAVALCAALLVPLAMAL